MYVRRQNKLHPYDTSLSHALFIMTSTLNRSMRRSNRKWPDMPEQLTGTPQSMFFNTDFNYYSGTLGLAGMGSLN